MSQPSAVPAIDPDEIRKFSFNVWNFKQGEVVSMMIHIGDRLGLYQALDGAGPVMAAELAEKTGLHERWLLEWLRNQAAARLLTYHDGERFELTPVGAAVLADEGDSLAYATGAFTAMTTPETMDKLVDAFRNGIGLTYEELGPNAAHRTERMLGPWTRQALIPQILPALGGVTAKLEAGGRAADVGCGGGLALTTMAAAYPNTQFHGYDPSAHAIARAKSKVDQMGLKNVELSVAGGASLPKAPTFDFIINFPLLRTSPSHSRHCRYDAFLCASGRACRDRTTRHGRFCRGKNWCMGRSSSWSATRPG